MAYINDDKLKAAFAEFDKDGSGTIEAKEILKCVMDMGIEEEQAKAYATKILKDTDADGDKKITWEEFKSALA